MDYKIKFEYQGIGKKAADIRNKVLQGQKSASQKTGFQQSTQSKDQIMSIKKLNDSITKLIASNKELARSIKSGGGFGGGGIGVRGGGGDSSAGFGRMGAAIPILGAGIAAMGFAIQKINQIGNAWIEKVSQQAGTAGIGGFRGSGRGMYLSAQMGAGMKAYGVSTGKFAGDIKTKDIKQGAFDVGTLYGLSAEETFGTAGKFVRAGANYSQAAKIGLGTGIQSELPMLLTGMADMFTEAVREGVNTSSLSKDMAKDISAIVRADPNRSVESALNIVKSFAGVQKQVAGGKMGTTQGLYTTRAAQESLMERLKDPVERKKLIKRGVLDVEQEQAIERLGPNATFGQLTQAAPSAAFPLLRMQAAEMSPADLQKRMVKQVKSEWGQGAKGFQRFSDFATQTGWNLNQSQIETLWRTGEIEEGAEKKGAIELRKRAKAIEKGPTGTAIQRARGREGLIMEFGSKFAEQSLAMERSMIAIAREAAPAVISGMNLVGDVATGLANSLKSLKDEIDKSKNKKGEIEAGELLKNLFSPF